MDLTQDQQEHLHRLFYEELGIEPCGLPWTAVRTVYEALQLMPTWEHDEELADLLGGDGPRQFLMSHLLRVGLLSTGSLPSAWLDDRGKVLLRWLDGVEIEDDLYEEYGDFGEVGPPHYGQPCSAQCWEGTWRRSIPIRS